MLVVCLNCVRVSSGVLSFSRHLGQFLRELLDNLGDIPRSIDR